MNAHRSDGPGKKAFLLGAGASRGSIDAIRVPVAAEFGEELLALDPSWRDHYPALASVIEHLGLNPNRWSLEPVWSCLDFYAKLQPALPLPKPWQDESRQIKGALLAVYGRRCDAEAEKTADDSTLAHLFRTELQPGDALVSFNYDTIAERIAKKWGPELRSSPHGSGVAFAKPHGSTSWNLNSRPVAWHDAGTPLFESLAIVDAAHEPLLLGAVPIKSELIREVQHQVPEVFDAICVQWRQVVEAIRDADTIFVVGYSFPPEDLYGRFLVREGLRLRAPRRDLRVEFFEIEDNEANRARELAEVFRGHVREIVFRGPVKPWGAV